MMKHHISKQAECSRKARHARTGKEFNAAQERGRSKGSGNISRAVYYAAADLIGAACLFAVLFMGLAIAEAFYG